MVISLTGIPRVAILPLSMALGVTSIWKQQHSSSTNYKVIGKLTKLTPHEPTAPPPPPLSLSPFEPLLQHLTPPLRRPPFSRDLLRIATDRLQTVAPKGRTTGTTR
ncbi:hypothetical protein BDZ91DRAFT_768408 [Kalaharituber pfeilii]|nr:hypothetical protein BDZ91DRAFT_768408 [Kalaharituber pfeilii]